MRTPEELENYFMSSNRGEGNSLSFKDFFAEIQKESYNQAVEDAVDSADADYTQIDDSNFSIGHRIEVYVIKDSILKLKIK